MLIGLSEAEVGVSVEEASMTEVVELSKIGDDGEAEVSETMTEGTEDGVWAEYDGGGGAP